MIFCRISVMYVNVNVCEIVLIMSESLWVHEFSEAILLSYQNYDGKCYCFRMHAYDWWRIRGATSGEDGRRSPLPFFEYWKKWPNIGKKNALIVFSHELNIHLCSHLKSCFKSTYEEKLQNFPLWRLTFMCCRWNVYRSALILRNLSCEIPVCTPAFGFHSWQINWLLNHVYTVPDRFFLPF